MQRKWHSFLKISLLGKCYFGIVPVWLQYGKRSRSQKTTTTLRLRSTLVDPTPSEPEPCWGEEPNFSETVKPFILFENTVWGNLNFVPENEPPSSRTLRELRKQYISHYSPSAKLVAKLARAQFVEMLEERKRMKSLMLLSAEVIIRDLKGRDLGDLTPGIWEYLDEIGAKHGVRSQEISTSPKTSNSTRYSVHSEIWAKFS